MRKYIALYEYGFYGSYTGEIEFYSSHSANSKANKEDAMREILKHKERGIHKNIKVIKTYLA